ncbi:rod-determining factor RdfA [Halolamina salina]|uniref:Rod-determining factor RdfA n=1 Tax=Halolamina salina TaxID=1220023 RepID=A0ABD6B535_9EURY
MSDSGTSNGAGRRGKVVKLIEAHGLDGIGDRLERLWTASGDERRSLRDLADEFNRELLRSTMAEAGMQPLDGEVDNTYRLLTDEEVGGGDRTRTERRLRREGVDVDSLREEFVTYQAIRTYLKGHRGASYDAESVDRAESEKKHIQRLRGRARTVTESKLEQLRDTDEIELGSFRTLVEVNVLCEDCGAQYDAEALLDRGGCDCEDT